MKVNTKSWTTFDTVRIADYEKTPKIYIYFLCAMCSNTQCFRKPNLRTWSLDMIFESTKAEVFCFSKIPI